MSDDKKVIQLNDETWAERKLVDILRKVDEGVPEIMFQVESVSGLKEETPKFLLTDNISEEIKKRLEGLLVRLKNGEELKDDVFAEGINEEFDDCLLDISRELMRVANGERNLLSVAQGRIISLKNLFWEVSTELKEHREEINKSEIAGGERGDKIIEFPGSKK